jgi:hypothetical protein
VTTVPVFREMHTLQSAFVFLLTPKSVVVLDLTLGRIEFSTIPLTALHISYSMQIDKAGDIGKVTCKIRTPTEVHPPFPEFTFSNEIGVGGALHFLSKFLRNRDD